MKRFLFAAFGSALLLASVEILVAGGINFDKLSDADRKVFSERFEKEIWPLMTRGGKQGCVGCHNGKIVADLRLSGDAKKDFAKMLKDGFFLHDDAGSLLARITDKDKTRRMPKDAEPWNAKDTETLRRFTEDMHKKEKK